MTVYVLKTVEGEVLVVCSTMDKLKEMVDRFIRELPDTNMVYFEYEIDEPEALLGDWVYIAHSDDPCHFKGKACYGGWDPPSEIWGLNLLSIDVMPYYMAYLQLQMQVFCPTEECERAGFHVRGCSG